MKRMTLYVLEQHDPLVTEDTWLPVSYHTTVIEAARALLGARTDGRTHSWRVVEYSRFRVWE